VIMHRAMDKNQSEADRVPRPYQAVARAPRTPEPSVEELSGSFLIEDAPDGSPVVKPAAPSVARGARTSSVKPPIPKSLRRGAAQAHRTLIGSAMPELPKSTPAPKQFFVPSATGEPMAIPVPEPVPDPFADVKWLPPPVPGAHAPQSCGHVQTNAEATRLPVTGDDVAEGLPRSGIGSLIEASKRSWKRLLQWARCPWDWMPRLAKRAQEALAGHSMLRSELRPRWFLPAVGAAASNTRQRGPFRLRRVSRHRSHPHGRARQEDAPDARR
jgi:hypothetical protein